MIVMQTRSFTGKVALVTGGPANNFRFAGNTSRINARRGDHFLQAVSGLIRTVEPGFLPVSRRSGSYLAWRLESRGQNHKPATGKPSSVRFYFTFGLLP
jgi:hypothetical protein